MSNKKPSREFLSMVIILLRRSQIEIGDSFVSWLEHFEDENSDIDTYDNTQLRLAVSNLLKELHPEERQPLNPEDWLEEDEEPLPAIQPLDEPDQPAEQLDDEGDLPMVEKL